VKTLRHLRSTMGEMRTCRQVGRLLQSYLDGELDEDRIAQVGGHLDHCRRCGMEASTYARIKEALAAVQTGGALHPEDRLAIDRLRRFADQLSGSWGP
jgi:anti-sigma factor RsiW